MDKQTVELSIEGMTCDHCAVTIQRALTKVRGVQRAEVSFPQKRAEISTTEAPPDALVRAVEKAGYRAAVIKPPKIEAASPQGARHVSSGRAPDVVVLGGGSAGFAASIRAAELGARVTLIEGGTLGGTCVLVFLLCPWFGIATCASPHVRRSASGCQKQPIRSDSSARVKETRLSGVTYVETPE